MIHRPRRLLEQDRCECDEVPVTSVPRTLLDLGASLGQTDLRRAFGRAERLEVLDFAAVEELVGRTIGHRGLKRLRILLGDLTPATATRSELERRFLELVRAAGLPQPAVSITVAGLEVDAVWPAERLAVELDGYAHHRGREAFERDRERELILAAEGFERLRFTWLMIERGGGSAVALVGKKLAERRAQPTWAS